MSRDYNNRDFGHSDDDDRYNYHQDRVVLEQPSCFQKMKLGAQLGGSVGAVLGMLFGGYTLVRFGSGGQSAVGLLARTMLSTGGSFALFMGIGAGLRCDDEPLPRMYNVVVATQPATAASAHRMRAL